MDHFKGVNETERYNNDLLNEIRQTNQLLQILLERNAQTVETQTADVKSVQRRGRGRQKGAVSQ